ncbi:MAG: (2Fe-2S) ferredoxin domain-containing protein [Ignavibacteria bacterium]|nr:(2Fe-2S) ferredoxin domain-containing protein [Ignavibacteria bacterium]
MTRFAKHIFICENERPAGHPRGCCKEKGGPALRQRFRDELKARGLQVDVRANSAGCLDACEFGAAVVVYPDGIWYGGVTVDDVTEIIDAHLVNGVPVERLRIRDDRYTRF